jgi:hypothetical protein
MLIASLRPFRPIIARTIGRCRRACGVGQPFKLGPIIAAADNPVPGIGICDADNLIADRAEFGARLLESELYRANPSMRYVLTKAPAMLVPTSSRP